jgi:hypothetical protein
MTRFADTLITVTDNLRTSEIAAYEAARVDRDFTATRKAAAANIAVFNTSRTWSLA